MTRDVLGEILNTALANLEVFVKSPDRVEKIDQVCRGLVEIHNEYFEFDSVSCDVFLVKSFQIVMSTKDMLFIKAFHKSKTVIELIMDRSKIIWVACDKGGYTKEQLAASLVQAPGLTVPFPEEVSSVKSGCFNHSG